MPSLAVINPTESIFVTSSYVKVPPIVTFPLAVKSVHVNAPLTLVLLVMVSAIPVVLDPS